MAPGMHAMLPAASSLLLPAATPALYTAVTKLASRLEASSRLFSSSSVRRPHPASADQPCTPQPPPSSLPPTPRRALPGCYSTADLTTIIPLHTPFCPVCCQGRRARRRRRQGAAGRQGAARRRCAAGQGGDAPRHGSGCRRRDRQLHRRPAEQARRWKVCGFLHVRLLLRWARTWPLAPLLTGAAGVVARRVPVPPPPHHHHHHYLQADAPSVQRSMPRA